MMPIANVIRIMRKVLPAHAKISDDAKETIQECVSEYISFITAEANDRCRSEHRKTVTADDLLFSMSKLGFHDYVHPLSLYLRRYRHLEGAADFRGPPRPAPICSSTTRPSPLGPMHTTLGGEPMARDLGYGPGGPMWEGYFMNGSDVGLSQGPMMMNGFDPYGPPPPYK
ncbi:Nuclear transcription factor Y subunit B-6 [Acorus gramineus]|uniref:Nuclear transcription factor Y subunit B-6 n=1 Tax=Acorus gramineus TaxID=55184 RepID=A0AAV9AXD0_ACOGR|nr:Nuclear transcription factor Y subunit B-6 [Acorus gramineus]